MNTQTEIDFSATFVDYHTKNPQIYEAFESKAFEAIRKGYKHMGAKAIFEIIRWETSVSGNDGYKVNNIYTPLYARLFEEKNPQYKGYFRKKKSKFDNQLAA